MVCNYGKKKVIIIGALGTDFHKRVVEWKSIVKMIFPLDILQKNL
jgi:hypothetical protein